jgi:hypothetical protein
MLLCVESREAEERSNDAREVQSQALHLPPQHPFLYYNRGLGVSVRAYGRMFYENVAVLHVDFAALRVAVPVLCEDRERV